MQNKITLDNIEEALVLIADLFSNFKAPVTEAGNTIWLNHLNGLDKNIFLAAISNLVANEAFFSFSKLKAEIDALTKPALPAKADVIATIKKMATNSRQNISNCPVIIQQTIRHAGGLIKLGQREWDQWLEKEIAAAYDEAARVIERDELHKLNAPERLKLNE